MQFNLTLYMVQVYQSFHLEDIYLILFRSHVDKKCYGKGITLQSVLQFTSAAVITPPPHMSPSLWHVPVSVVCYVAANNSVAIKCNCIYYLT